VLIVDDFADNRGMYVQFLTFLGYRVAEASNGVEAIERALELRPDVIVMDLSLPMMDGWQATRLLKQNPQTRGTPVIALTGHALPGQSKGAREAGCDVFLTKPCLPEALADSISQTLDARPSRPRRRK
jgi:CheY-like chemotaxis protein